MVCSLFIEKLFNETNGDKWYVDENDSGYNLHIINFNEFSGITTTPQTESSPSQTVNGVVIYTSSSNSGAHVGEPRYKAYIENHDLNTLIWVSSPDANEQPKMASTLKFK